MDLAGADALARSTRLGLARREQADHLDHAAVDSAAAGGDVDVDGESIVGVGALDRVREREVNVGATHDRLRDERGGDPRLAGEARAHFTRARPGERRGLHF